MASIRRTLSPVPRPGTLLGGEACSVASPLSKSSSSPLNPNYPQSPLDHLLYRVQAFVLGIFSQRSSRSLERTKVKGQIWRKALFHFFACFIVGVFVGVTPFVSTNLSLNHISNHQAFSFEVLPSVEKIQVEDHISRNLTEVSHKLAIPDNGTLHSNGTSVGSFVNVTQLHKKGSSNEVFHKLLIVVTPTYTRPFQAYYLNRLAYTLKLVHSPLLWIVVEMSSQSVETAEILRRTGVVYRHLVCTKNLTEIKDKRVHQRNVALSHIETHRLDGIVYFADDANIYSTELFEQMRQIRRFGTWTVAKLMENKSQYVLEGPICNGTRVIGWHTSDPRRRFRRFHAEMSGFAFNSTILWDPTRWHQPTLEPIRQVDTVKNGFQVSAFIEQIVQDESEMEGLPQICSKIMVWHLRIDSSYSYPQDWVMKNNLDAIAPLA
ncbi:hypothetical protein LguiB_027914 [Lonicera macranthoides]